MDKSLSRNRISESNKLSDGTCNHNVVISTGFQKYESPTFLEEADGVLEIATYFCLDCSSSIKVPVTQRFAEIIEFEKKPRIVIKCQRNLTLEELDLLRTNHICRDQHSDKLYIMRPKRQTDKSDRQKI